MSAHPPAPSLHVIAHHSEVQPKHLCTATESQAEESRGFKASQSHGSEDFIAHLIPPLHFVILGQQFRLGNALALTVKFSKLNAGSRH